MLITGYSRVFGGGAAPAVVQFTAHSDQSFDTSADLALPAGIAAGNQLVAVLRTGALNTVTPPSGWTLVDSDESDTGIYVYERTADGTEGGTTATWTTGTTKSGFIFAEVSGGSTVEVTFAPASTDPPSHTPAGGSAATAWLAVTTMRRNDNSVDAAPAGYSGLVEAESSATDSTSGGEVTVGGAHLESTASSEDPGTFTLSGSTGTGAQAATISVR